MKALAEIQGVNANGEPQDKAQKEAQQQKQTSPNQISIRENPITQWFRQLTPDAQLNFVKFCQINFHRRRQIDVYLQSRSVICSVADIYEWVDNPGNVPLGNWVQKMVDGVKDVQGLEALPVIQQSLKRLVEMEQRLFKRIEAEEDELTTRDCLNLYGTISKEVRGYATQLNQLTSKADVQAIALGSAARLIEIILGDSTLQGTPEEAYIRKLCEMAMIRLSEEQESDLKFGNRR